VAPIYGFLTTPNGFRLPQKAVNALLEIARTDRYGAAVMGGRLRHPRGPDSERMSDNIVPHFHNDLGVASIDIGAKEFMCVGANPPFDHPHVYCDMGDDVEYICPYCSTLYRHDPKLAPRDARPAECALNSPAA
jgi:uncharacterized Zn-finger protein